MRTTIDIDERALVAARAKAAAEGTSLGRALSDLVLTATGTTAALPPGFPVFRTVPGHVITSDLVADHRDDI